jgi:hypothetical protein
MEWTSLQRGGALRRWHSRQRHASERRSRESLDHLQMHSPLKAGRLQHHSARIMNGRCAKPLKSAASNCSVGTSLKAFLMDPSPRLRRPSHGAPAAAAAAAAASARKGPSSGGAAGSASAVSPERDIFMIVDRDRRGAISFDELKAGVFLFCFFERRPQNHAPTEDELHAWFEDASLNDDGQMERDTFESILRVEMDPQRRARRAREGPQTPSRRPPQASNSKPWPTSPPSPMNQAANVVPAGFIRSFAIATPPSSPRAAVKSSTYTSFHALGRGSAF